MRKKESKPENWPINKMRKIQCLFIITFFMIFGVAYGENTDKDIDFKVEIAHNTQGYLVINWEISNNGDSDIFIPSSFILENQKDESALERANFYWVEVLSLKERSIRIRLGNHATRLRLSYKPRKYLEYRYVKPQLGAIAPKSKAQGELMISPILEINELSLRLLDRMSQKRRDVIIDKLNEDKEKFLCNIIFEIDIMHEEKTIREVSVSEKLDWCADGITYSPELLPQNIPYMGANKYKAYYPEIIWRNKEVQKKW